KRKCTPKRRPRASPASPPTSGRCCAARGRGPLHRERESRLKPRLGPAALALLLAAGSAFVPADGRWSPAARLPQPMQELSAATPALRGASGAAAVSGKLIVVGGWGLNRRLVPATAIYDPAVDRWRDGAAIPTPRDHLAAAAVNGLVYAIGGRPLDPDRNYDV